MHRLMAGGTILEHELSDLRLLVERQAGILLDCPNSALAAHVAEYLEAQELDSVAAVLERLRSADQDPACLPHFLDGVLNTNTGFFRHPGAMNALTRQVLPQLFARKSPDNPATLRMWSAGCSTGEEAYSIAMAACAALAVNTANIAANGNGNGALNSGANAVTPSNGNGSSNGSSGGKNAASRNGGITESSGSAAGQIFRSREENSPFTSWAATCLRLRSKSPSAACIRSLLWRDCLRPPSARHFQKVDSTGARTGRRKIHWTDCRTAASRTTAW